MEFLWRWGFEGEEEFETSERFGLSLPYFSEADGFQSFVV